MYVIALLDMFGALAPVALLECVVHVLDMWFTWKTYGTPTRVYYTRVVYVVWVCAYYTLCRNVILMISRSNWAVRFMCEPSHDSVVFGQ